MVRLTADNLVVSSKQNASKALLQPFSPGPVAKNEMLFFFKPETFLLSSVERSKVVINLAFDSFERFGVGVAGAMLFSGEVLAELGLMDRHYGYINRLSRGASHLVSEDDRQHATRELGGLSPETIVLGGHEALQRFPQFDAHSLNDLWATKKSVRLRGGFYFQVFTINGVAVLLINGFHPAQLLHFTGAGRQTAVCLLHSNAHWKSLRWQMIGDGFPERADPSSVRGLILKSKTELGLESVTIANNFVHLSAGPFEALFEIHNFLSTDSEAKVDLGETNMGHIFRGVGLKDQDLRSAIEDTMLFSKTEDVDSAEAVLKYGEMLAVR
jgi:hypothetical protein